MRKIYIDSDFICHVENADGRREIETDFFDGKCNTFIEGYRYIPEGETWTRSDGEVFSGLMISPAKDYSLLMMAQSAYEEALSETASQIADLTAKNEDMTEALSLLGVTINAE